MATKIGVGIVGTGFIAKVHLDSIRQFPDLADVVAVADIDEEKGKAFQQAFSVPRFYKSHLDMLDDKDVQAIVMAVPNYLHYQVTMDALRSGRHVICEKPLALSLKQGREMLELAKKQGLVLGYAEELCFIPKFKKAKELMESGGIGDVYLVRQCEKHAGPYSPWFFKEETAGGGALMDMGCHSIECIRWVMGKKKVRSVIGVMGTYLHHEVTKMDDHILVIMEFEDGTLGQAEASWALKGGMDSFLEIFGKKGVIYADLLKGMGLRAYSEEGFLDMWEPNKGWVYPDYDWLWNNGYPQEDRHFIECMIKGEVPMENAEDGLVVLEIMLAAYHSAGTGQKVMLPFRPMDVDVPVYLWQKPRFELGCGPTE
jgi:predicted dehydrogenase